MPIYKNVANQKIYVYAWDDTTAAGSDPSKTGDAANITAEIVLDEGTSAATNDANPTELEATDHPGLYVFDLTAAETNADRIAITPVSATSNILLSPVVIYTRPAAERTIVHGAVETGTTAAATDQFSTDLSEATIDHYNGRVVIFTSGNLADQQRPIADYQIVSGEGSIVVDPVLTEAPVDGDTFVIV